jgi:hypothetical protein
MSNGCTPNGEIIKTYIIDDAPGLSGCTLSVDEIISCSNSGITVFDTILPSTDDTINLGIPSRRFRDINTISGTSTVWKSERIWATTVVETPLLDLGLDLSGNTRQITANNSIIQDDILLGGDY